MINAIVFAAGLRGERTMELLHCIEETDGSELAEPACYTIYSVNVHFIQVYLSSSGTIVCLFNEWPAIKRVGCINLQ